MTERISRSFIRRGRMTRSQKQGLSDYGDTFLLPMDSLLRKQDVFGRSASLYLEIGFGNGDNLLYFAEQNPQADFIGVDVHLPGIGVVLREAGGRGIGNIRVYQHDVVEVLSRVIMDNSFLGCCIFFPDPWPKKKHQKRRLLQPTFVDLLRQKITVNGFVWIATDLAEYGQYIQQVFTCDGRWTRVAVSDTGLQRLTTRFEEKSEKTHCAVYEAVWKKSTGDTKKPCAGTAFLCID